MKHRKRNVWMWGAPVDTGSPWHVTVIEENSHIQLRIEVGECGATYVDDFIQALKEAKALHEELWEEHDPGIYLG